MFHIKITVDTKEDSPEDIRKVVAFLSSLSDGVKEHNSNIFESSEPELGSSEAPPAFVNMFGGSEENKDVVDETPILGVNSEEKKE